MIRRLSAVFCILLVLNPSQAESLAEEAHESLGKAVSFFHSLNNHGGYVHYVTPDLRLRWGEKPVDEDTIEVQPPGTPAVGMSFLRAFKVTGDEKALAAATDAAYALLKGQNRYGGWEHTIDFTRPTGKKASFDDNQTQSSILFLMALDQEIDDQKLKAGVEKALNLMLESQLDHGGWPHVYPEQGNYHDYATFNDGGINDCIHVMAEAWKYYGDDAIEKSLRKGARFIYISQLPPPQPGWAQQYNEFLQPAWARTFEPPAVCPSVTIKNINSLMNLYLLLGDKDYLEPIPDSLRWLEECRLENGKWARFVEIGTGKALYYDRDRIRVDSLEELHPERSKGYGYQVDLSKQLEAAIARYNSAMNMSRDELLSRENPVHTAPAALKKMNAMTKQVKEIIESQEESGAWITYNDRFKKQIPKDIRWNGQYEEMDRISSAVFNRNVKILCEYIELSKLTN